MKSGMLAAEAAFEELEKRGRSGDWKVGGCFSWGRDLRWEADSAETNSTSLTAFPPSLPPPPFALVTNSNLPTPPTLPPQTPITLTSYPKRLETSWIWTELEKERNIRPGFRWGLLPGLVNAAVTTWLTRGKEPWTLKHR
jgi:flavin-dependent dehydrogenase